MENCARRILYARKPAEKTSFLIYSLPAERMDTQSSAPLEAFFRIEHPFFCMEYAKSLPQIS